MSSSPFNLAAYEAITPKELIALPPEEQVAILSVSGSVNKLTRDTIKSVTLGMYEAVMNVIKALELEQQVAILSVHSMVSDLAGWGREKAKAVMDIITALQPEQQTKILSAPHAVFGLVRWGEAKPVMGIIDALQPEQQASILSTTFAIRGLAEKGQAEAVMDIIKTLKPEQQVTMATAFCYLGLEGQQEALEKIMSSAAFKFARRVANNFKSGGAGAPNTGTEVRAPQML